MIMHLGSLRAWSRRTRSQCDDEGAQFLQEFINSVVDKVGMLPGGFANMTCAIWVPTPWNRHAEGAQAMKPLPITANGFVDTRAMFDDQGHDGEYGHVIRAAWQSVVISGMSKGGLKLSSGSVDLCHLGDLVVFLLSDMGLQVHGVLYGLGVFMLRQFDMWLVSKLPQLLQQEDQAAHVHSLKGIFGRSLARDPRRLAGAVASVANGHTAGLGQWGRDHDCPDKHAARMIVWSYTKHARQCMDHENLTRGMCLDGAKAAGEGMLLAFSYSPVINLGAFLPFQVPYPFTHVYELHCSNILTSSIMVMFMHCTGLTDLLC